MALKKAMRHISISCCAGAMILIKWRRSYATRLTIIVLLLLPINYTLHLTLVRKSGNLLQNE